MSNKQGNFRDLIVWQKAHQFVLEAYKFTDVFPKKEDFGLTSQFRRAAISIASNIAEGYTKSSKPDKIRYYNISRGSLEECRYYLLLSRDLKYGDTKNLETILEEVSKLLTSYINKIKESI